DLTAILALELDDLVQLDHAPARRPLMISPKVLGDPEQPAVQPCARAPLPLGAEGALDRRLNQILRVGLRPREGIRKAAQRRKVLRECVAGADSGRLRTRGDHGRGRLVAPPGRRRNYVVRARGADHARVPRSPASRSTTAAAEKGCPWAGAWKKVI